MKSILLPVVIHGVTGRMGQIALRALQKIAQDETVKIDGDVVSPIAIGVDIEPERLKTVAAEKNLEHYFTDLQQALDLAHQLNPKQQIYHNTVATGVRRQVMLPSIAMLDASTTAVYMEKPLAPNYGDGFAIVDALEQRNITHGVVHQFLATPGISRAMEMIPEIKPLSVQMVFGYEVGPGLGGNKEFSGQRPDFNWRLKDAGGGIILDMCHEGYISEALFGETKRLSAVARLLVPQRMSTDGKTVINCDVEDFVALRREHDNGVVNTSIWSWYRRVNSEFGPLEITVEGENGSLVFGLYGLKVQWKETAPANHWERSVSGEKIEWRDHWEYVDMSYQDPFAFELIDFINSVLTGKKYRKDAIHALNVLGEVEAFYKSAAKDGMVMERNNIFCYPQKMASDWQPERLQGKLNLVKR
jgi:predicted dehydrogenase